MLEVVKDSTPLMPLTMQSKVLIAADVIDPVHSVCLSVTFLLGFVFDEL
jgi:hypothetical protein